MQGWCFSGNLDQTITQLNAPDTLENSGKQNPKMGFKYPPEHSKA